MDTEVNRKMREASQRSSSTYVAATDVVFLVDTDDVYRVTGLERYEAETFLDVLLAIKRLLNQLDLQNGKFSLSDMQYC